MIEILLISIIIILLKIAIDIEQINNVIKQLYYDLFIKGEQII